MILHTGSASQGMPFEQYLEMMGMDIDGFRSFYRPQAEYQVKLNLSLEKIAELENLEVGTEAIEEEYNKLAEQYNMEADKVKILLPEEGMKSDLLLRKAADFVKENAVAVLPPTRKMQPVTTVPVTKKQTKTRKTRSAAKPAGKKTAKSGDKAEKGTTGDRKARMINRAKITGKDIVKLQTTALSMKLPIKSKLRICKVQTL